MPWSEKKVVINNYKKWHDELKQIIESSNAEKSAMSDEERKKEESQDRAEVNELIQKINDSRRRTLMIPRYIQRLYFEMLCRELLKYAGEEPTDLTIESDARHGVIRMVFEQLILDDQHPVSYRRLWKWLMSCADDIWAAPIQKYGDSALQYTFIFDFQKKIRL